MKLDLFTNATVVDDAIRFVSGSENEKSKDKDKGEQVKSAFFSSDSNNEDDNKEPHDEKSDKVVGEEKQEQEKVEITVNQVF